MPAEQTPRGVIWDVTYACPLRCFHCYSESGRRPSRQLDRDGLLAVADAVVAMRPEAVAFAGGEPLVVPGLFEVADRIAAAGVTLTLYTGGWSLPPATAEAVVARFDQVTVSIDGATAATHDRVRGRAGSYERALAALDRLDQATGRARAAGGRAPLLGVDYTVVRSNLAELAAFCRDVAPRFPHLDAVSFGAAVPSGLASRPGFDADELLTEDELAQLREPGPVGRLRALAPPGVAVGTTDNRILQMHPDLVSRGLGFPVMQVEPDGAVRAMAIYEGTVGNLRDEPGAVLWQRAQERWRDPYVVSTLAPVRTMRDWAEAARRLDRRFGSAEVRARLDRRPAHVPLAATPA